MTAQTTWKGPLAGLKVVELGQNLAGPYAAAIFGELGADVVKVEKKGGDDARQWGPPFVEGKSITFHMINRNKKSVELSLDRPADREAFLNLIREADVFVHNLRPGVAEKLNIGGEEMLKLNPRLIYCEQSAFGHKGPMRLKPGYEPLLQAFAGLISINGDPNGPPSRIGPSVVDLGTGMWSVIGALTALIQRNQTGKGAIIRNSLFETALSWAARHAGDYGATGKIPPRVGTGHNSLTPYQAFEAKDGPVVIAAGNDRLYAKLCQVLGHEEWITDPRFVTNADRTANRPVLVGMIGELIREKTMAEWVELLEAVGVPCAPIHSIPQVLEHEQTKAMGLVLDSPLEQLKLVALPFSIDDWRPGFGTVAPDLGADQAQLAPGTLEQGRAAE
ncbi:CaiB/BaiF CoA transferase family protein [Daeguia caeni]|uniref:CaiB/BaiF CoA transferase family protein n=1 Tax=Daeguia caeni TaxID=439612 RepID=A0ABV9HA24_9HYPH